MSIMSLANSLMLDFRCVIIPRFVYSTGADFAEGQVANPALHERLVQLAGAAGRSHAPAPATADRPRANGSRPWSRTSTWIACPSLAARSPRSL